MASIQPFGDKVIIKDDSAQEVSAGGLIIPKVGQEKPTTGTVIAVGPGLITDAGAEIEMYIQVGDRVMFDQSAGEVINFEGEEIRIVRQHMVIGKIV